jgi:hypothetical protein
MGLALTRPTLGPYLTENEIAATIQQGLVSQSIGLLEHDASLKRAIRMRGIQPDRSSARVRFRRIHAFSLIFFCHSHQAVRFA